MGGQAVRLRAGRSRDQARGADPRRLRLRQGVPRRARLPRRQDLHHRRGDLGDSAAGDRPAAPGGASGPGLLMEELARLVARGDAGALAPAISLVEEGTPRGELTLGDLSPRPGRASILGVTGPPGAGKSTLVNRLVALYRSRGRTLGVIAVDPSSAFSGGAVLGDRIRMQEHAL